MDSVVDEDRVRTSDGRFVAGLACGVVVGVAAGLLLAPRRGSELRDQIADTMNQAGRRARESYDRASESVTLMAGRAATVAEDFTERAANLTSKLNSAISSKVSNYTQPS